MRYSPFVIEGYHPLGTSMEHITAVMADPDSWLSSHSVEEIMSCELYARGIVGIWNNSSEPTKLERLRNGFNLQNYEMCKEYLYFLEQIKKQKARRWGPQK